MLYHKIKGPFLRAADNTLTSEWSDIAFEQLKDHDWLFTEKVDGTNIRVIWDGYRVSFGGRTENAEIPADLLAHLEEKFAGPVNEQKFEQAFGEKEVVIYGEGYGPRINNGGKYSSTVKFSPFDIRIGGMFLVRNDVVEIANLFTVEPVPVFFIRTLREAIEAASKGLNSSYGDFEAEGLVGTPVGGFLNRQGRRIVVKLKCSDLK